MATISIRYENGDELVHTDSHQFCSDPLCPCHDDHDRDPWADAYEQARERDRQHWDLAQTDELANLPPYEQAAQPTPLTDADYAELEPEHPPACRCAWCEPVSYRDVINHAPWLW